MHGGRELLAPRAPHPEHDSDRALRRHSPSRALRPAFSISFLRRRAPAPPALVGIAVAFANPETTTGGNALKFYASVRLDVRRIGQVKAGENNIGNRTRVKVVKNKMAPPFGTCEFDIRFGSGIDALGDLLDIAAETGIVGKNGSYYTYGDESLGQGRERARALLIERPELFAKIEAQVLGKDRKVTEVKEAKAA